MARTAYHRAYYWRRVEARRATARASRASQRLVRRWTRLIGEAVDEARQDKKALRREAEGGLYNPRGKGYPVIAVKDEGSVAHALRPSTFTSAFLDGATTRRTGLNLDRGSGPLDAQHRVGKREPQQGNL